MKEPVVGESARFTWEVTPDLTADRFGNEGVHVLATPAVAALFEGAAVRLIQPLLDGDELTVGTEIRVSHEAATPLGLSVTVAVRLVAAHGNRLEFDLVASDPHGEVARGSHTRAVLPKGLFDRLVAARVGGER